MSVVYCEVTGKQAYARRAEAERVMRRVQRRPGCKRQGARVYRCEHCDHYHLTAHGHDLGRRLRRWAAAKERP